MPLPPLPGHPRLPGSERARSIARTTGCVAALGAALACLAPPASAEGPERDPQARSQAPTGRPAARAREPSRPPPGETSAPAHPQHPPQGPAHHRQAPAQGPARPPPPPAMSAVMSAEQPGTAHTAMPGPAADGFSVQGGRPTLVLGGGLLTVQPLLRLDGDAGGFPDQPRGPRDRPPRFLDTARPGVPDHGLALRRARVGLQGGALHAFTWVAAWEFAQAPGSRLTPVKSSRLYELQAAYAGLPWITPRIGAFGLMHTLELATSSLENPFLERPSIIAAATGLASGDSRMALGAEARGAHWFAAAYLSAGTTTALHDGRQRGLAGRVSGMALDTEGMQLVLGANAAAQFRPVSSGRPDAVRLRDYPELRLEPTRLLDTRPFVAGAAHALGPELAARAGPLVLLAEYQRIATEGPGAAPSHRGFRGWYVTAALPLAGSAPRRWEPARGAFVRPAFEPLDPAAGHWGWTELALRWSWIGLNDGAVRGGSQGVLSAALAWHPTRRLRASVQYSLGTVRLDGPDRAFQALAGRVAFNW